MYPLWLFYSPGYPFWRNFYKIPSFFEGVGDFHVLWACFLKANIIYLFIPSIWKYGKYLKILLVGWQINVKGLCSNTTSSESPLLSTFIFPLCFFMTLIAVYIYIIYSPPPSLEHMFHEGGDFVFPTSISPRPGRDFGTE